MFSEGNLSAVGVLKWLCILHAIGVSNCLTYHLQNEHWSSEVDSKCSLAWGGDLLGVHVP